MLFQVRHFLFKVGVFLLSAAIGKRVSCQSSIKNMKKKLKKKNMKIESCLFLFYYEGKSIQWLGAFLSATDWPYDLQEVNSTLRSLASCHLDIFSQCRFQVWGLRFFLRFVFIVSPCLSVQIPFSDFAREDILVPWTSLIPQSLVSGIWTLPNLFSLCFPVFLSLLPSLNPIFYFQGLSCPEKLTWTDVFISLLLYSHLK